MLGFFDTSRLFGRSGDFAAISDTDWFAAMATICFLVVLAGMFPRVYHSRPFRVIALLCLMFMPVVQAIGSYYLSQPAP